MIKHVFYLFFFVSTNLLAMDVSKPLLELAGLVIRAAAKKNSDQQIAKKSTNDITFESIRQPNGRYKYCCSYCGKTIFNQNAHLAIHTGAKPYKCSICGKAYRQSGHLRGHQKSHLNESSESFSHNATDVACFEGEN